MFRIYPTLLLVLIANIAWANHEILLSDSPDRSNPRSLENAIVNGDAYIFVSPEADVDRVTFLVDGSLQQTENVPPYDLAGTAADDTAVPYDTSVLSDGTHVITADLLLFSGESKTITATFTVSNDIPSLLFSTSAVTMQGVESGSPASADITLTSSDGTAQEFVITKSTGSEWLSITEDAAQTPATISLVADPTMSGIGTFSATLTASTPAGTYAPDSASVTFRVSSDSVQLLFSESPTREPAQPLAGATVSGNAFVFVEAPTGISQVRFYLDDPTAAGTPDKIENLAPFDFAGTARDDSALPLDTNSISDGAHNIAASISFDSGDIILISSDFIVSNSSGGSPPSANFGFSCSDLACSFDATSSSDPDGSIVSYDWDFGDGASGAGIAVSHDYSTLSTYTVTLTVVDDDGLSDTETAVVDLTAGNIPPSALFDHSCIGLDCTFDGSPSNDSDGVISNYAWDFGDGNSGSGVNPLHSYAASGSYDVTLTVTDDGGAIASSTVSINVSEGNSSPNADFSVNCNDLACSFDGTSSSDTDGSITSYTWDFGDSGSATGSSPSYNYAAPDTYDVTLTVTDDLGDSGSITKAVTVGAGVGCSSISSLDCNQVRVTGDLFLNFDGTDGGLLDKNGNAIGFTMVDPPSNPGNPQPDGVVPGYWPARLEVDTAAGLLRIQTSAGIQHLTNNNQDNTLGFGLNVPSASVALATKLVSLPNPAPGGWAQAGLWMGRAGNFGRGTSEDNYIKLVVTSPRQGQYLIQAAMELAGGQVDTAEFTIPSSTSSLTLKLISFPTSRVVQAVYNLGAGDVSLASFSNVPDDWFSFDQAGIDPDVATRSHGGIFGTHRRATSSQTYSFEYFSITENPAVTVDAGYEFDRWFIPVSTATAMAWGPDDRLYVAGLFGTIRAFTLDSENRVVLDEQVIDAIRLSHGGNRLTLGLAVDPKSTPENVMLWVAHSDGSLNNGQENSGVISRVSGASFDVVEDRITGLPRAIANHAINHIHFGPDGRLYVSAGGNTGAGAANLTGSEFGDRPEQPLSAAILVADVNSPGFQGSCATPIGEFGIPAGCDVRVYASGLRNTYDHVWHSNGYLYATDNGLGVQGTVPPFSTPPCTGLGDPNSDDPGSQPDLLLRIEEGLYYGHPNPYRDECVFKEGSFQGASPLPNYQPPTFILGQNLSANGIIDYRGDAFYSKLMGQLLISNFSVGDSLTRVALSRDGLQVQSAEPLVANFTDPLPLAQDPDGNIYVGELNASRIAVLVPKPLAPAPVGQWLGGASAPGTILDAGGGSIGNQFFMVGGKNAAGHLSTLFIHDTVGDLWTQGTPLPGTGVENPAVTAYEGKLYAFGGSTEPFSGAVATAAVYDPVADGWTSLPSMAVARGGARASVIDNKIYVVGGMGTDGASLSSVEIFDPSTGTWSQGPSMQTRRDNPGAASIGGKLYVFGGRTRNADSTVINGTLNSMEIYDPATGSWTFAPSMAFGRRAMAVGEISGRIQVMGGENPVSSVNEEFDPETGLWRTLTPMLTPRHGAASATINGAVHVVGGGDTAGSSFTDIQEIFVY